MSEKLVCPFCQQEYIIHKDDSCFGQQRCVCRNPNCEFDGWHFPVRLVSELIRTRKALEQSEICCTEWEKQALDYKAENIALSGDLERTRKALDVARHTIGWINQMIDEHVDKQAIKIKCEYALEQIAALEQKDEWCGGN